MMPSAHHGRETAKPAVCRFIVHFTANRSIELQPFIAETFKGRSPKILRGENSGFVTVEVEIGLSELRTIIHALPRSIIVSYEAP